MIHDAPFVIVFVVGVAQLTRSPTVRAHVKWVYCAIAKRDEIKNWNDFVDPLFNDKEKYKLELLKMSIAEDFKNCPHKLRRATKQVAIDIPDPDVETTGTATILDLGAETTDDDFVAGDNDEYDYDDYCDDHPDDYPDDIYGESIGLMSRLRGVSVFDSVELPTVSHVPQLLRSGNDLQELLSSEISRKHNRFCYIRCLDPVDGLLFQAKMIQLIYETCHDRNQQETIITQGCMKMRTWRRIMKQIQTVATYKLWRKAYWGENAGRTIVYSSHTHFHVLVESFEGQSGSPVVLIFCT